MTNASGAPIPAVTSGKHPGQKKHSYEYLIMVIINFDKTTLVLHIILFLLQVNADLAKFSYDVKIFSVASILMFSTRLDFFWMYNYTFFQIVLYTTK